MVLLRDQLIDALDSPQLKIQKGLASAMEFESLMKSSLSICRNDSSSGFKAQRAQSARQTNSKDHAGTAKRWDTRRMSSTRGQGNKMIQERSSGGTRVLELWEEEVFAKVTESLGRSLYCGKTPLRRNLHNQEKLGGSNSSSSSGGCLGAGRHQYS
ncbi:hypothetical protein E2C01_072910 [Portunus trituberculatus]|uniref:Uncharacterized protein n=1 Tax=Portunus trituberculatus TaxID=210409 RepID=A0A5B7ICM4_PORTR|nr:hypothetical protein [Portunus trituberculatus]